MECYDDSDKKLCDYCESCSILVNFSYDLHQEINDYITNGGDINNVESLSVDTLIPIENIMDINRNFIWSIINRSSYRN